MKRDSISETRKTATTTAGICLKNLPLIPGTKKSGRNATIFVSTANVIGIAVMVDRGAGEILKAKGFNFKAAFSLADLGL